MISYQDAATRLGIPEGDRGGFVEFVSSFPSNRPGGVEPDLFEQLAEDYRSVEGYHGSELERRVLEARLDHELPLVETVAIASRLASSFDSYRYGLFASVLRAQLTRSGECLKGEQLADVMGVPDEDDCAFFELLYKWVDDSEEWQAQVHGRAYGVEREPIPKGVLSAFWERYPSSESYPGSDLEGDVLVERGYRVRSIADVKRVLGRARQHVKVNPGRPAFELRGFFVGLEEGLCTYAFDESPSLQVAA